jgi:hypothetical protein
LTYLNVSADQSADINITTAEGDTVTLSSDYHAEATLLTYEHLAYRNSGYEAEKGELVDYNEERNVALSVEGTLSDQEMADIQALLSDLGEMLKAFLTGEGGGEGGVEEHSADISRYGSLSAFQADFEYKAGMQYVNLAADQLAVETAGPPQLPAATAASAAAAQPPPAAVAPEMPSPQTAAPAAAAAPVAAESAKPAAVQDDRAAGDMAKRVKESGLRPRRFMKLLKKFLRGLMQEMRANNVLDGERAKRGESILEKFFGQLEPASRVSEVTSTKVSMKQQWVSLQYEMKAEVKTQPSVEETA